MAKRTPITSTPNNTRRTSSTAATPPDAQPADALEARVLAFAERLGRIAGTVQARTADWRRGDALKKELARVRDGAADLLQQLTGDAPAVTTKRPAAKTAAAGNRGRSGGAVDAPGKKHRPPMPAGPGAGTVRSQAAKLRTAKTMVKTNRHRGRG